MQYPSDRPHSQPYDCPWHFQKKCLASAYAFEGLLAFQIHRGPAMEVHIKDVMLKELPEGGVIDFATHPIPSDAQIIEAKSPKKKAKGK